MFPRYEVWPFIKGVDDENKTNSYDVLSLLVYLVSRFPRGQVPRFLDRTGVREKIEFLILILIQLPCLRESPC